MNDLTGHVYGLLTVVSLAGTKYHPGGGSRRMWLCRCECGVETTVAGNNLRNNHTTSCGSKKHQNNYHGITNTKIYHVWENMLARCTNKNHPSWKDYGARGITVCERWLDFKLFYADMGAGWRDGLYLDRTDNDLGYYQDNCQWVTSLRSSLNKRTTRLWEHEGVQLTARELSVKASIPSNRIYSRLINGWTVQDAITKPMRHYPRTP